MDYKYLACLLHKSSLSFSRVRNYDRKLKEKLKQDGLIMIDRECQYGITHFYLVITVYIAEKNADSGSKICWGD